jgi:hypothetical protein
VLFKKHAVLVAAPIARECPVRSPQVALNPLPNECWETTASMYARIVYSSKFTGACQVEELRIKAIGEAENVKCACNPWADCAGESLA